MPSGFSIYILTETLEQLKRNFHSKQLYFMLHGQQFMIWHNLEGAAGATCISNIECSVKSAIKFLIPESQGIDIRRS